MERDLNNRGRSSTPAPRREWPLIPDSLATGRSSASVSAVVGKAVLMVWVIGLPVVIGMGLHAQGQVFHGLAAVAALAVLAAGAARAAMWLHRSSQKERR
jgi:hypothetical protein